MKPGMLLIIALIACTVILATIVSYVTLKHARKAIHLPTANMSTSTMTLESSAFIEGETIPTKYTCDGEESSIPLVISGVPKDAQSLVLFLEDPDTSMGTFTHWVVFNIPPDTEEILEKMPKTSLTFGTAGTNSAGTIEYIGPCPPSGVHRYIFTLYALDTILSQSAGAQRESIVEAMDGHMIAEARLTGTYGRQSRIVPVEGNGIIK